MEVRGVWRLRDFGPWLLPWGGRSLCAGLGLGGYPFVYFFCLDDVTTEDYSSLRYICEVVSRRASFMASAGITDLLKKMDYKDVVIAIDGSLFR